MITVLSGGVGAARLLRALRASPRPPETRAVVNVGDDLVLHGLTICPDLDTILYTLAGLNNDQTGWGLAGESWRVMAELEAIGGESWFRLGDRDLATHLYRTQRLATGATKTMVSAELVSAFGVDVTLLPVTDDPVATVFDSTDGRLSFQEYFVRHHTRSPSSASRSSVRPVPERRRPRSRRSRRPAASSSRPRTPSSPSTRSCRSPVFAT